ncbi:MAG: hypothetical protein Q8P02_03400 [Candidatus Micrarchaeota archaeon]|nr:hypothetical protein [Candidatus Micrarchaeota archaeon]
MGKRFPAIELITEVSGEDAKRLAKDLIDPTPNPAAIAQWERAKKLNIRLEDL